jgi:transposase
MSIRADDLPQNIADLQALARAQAARIEALETSLKALQAMMFGARSERKCVLLGSQMDLALDDLADAAPPPAANDDDPSQAGGQRPRKPANRNVGRLPKWLERIDKVIEPDITACPCCAGALHRIGEDISEALDIVPAILRVLRLVRPKYACRACEDGVVQAPAPPRAQTGGMATTRLMAHIAVAKFAWNLPLNRQTQMLAGQGIKLDRSTLSRWIKTLAWWTRPLYERQLQVMHGFPRIFCDETRMPVRREDKKTVHIGQFWAHATDDRPWNGPAPPAVVYVYAEGRAHKEIRGQLAAFQGLVQVDGYAGYNGLTSKGRKPGPITLAFCLAHARRKFTDLHKKTGSAFTADIIERFSRIYAIEAEIRGTSAAERRAVRQARSAPVMAALKTVLEEELSGLSTKSKTAEAIRYVLGHWAGLTLFLADGRLETDTNTVERSMRTIALGRRNSLFAGDDGGAESWAVLASLLNTCRLNEVDPFTWLDDVLERMVSGAVKANDLDQFLPWNWKAARAAQKQATAA